MTSCHTAGKMIVPVVLSGGTGSRLWPMSRASFPKQLWSLVSARSMLQETVLRGQVAGFAPPVIVCNEEHRFLIAEQLREVSVTGASIMLEPVGRNSAPAITAAALLVAQTHPEAVLWMMAADADIKKSDALGEAMAKAVQAAEQGRIVTFGMAPTRPETGYGYIEKGDLLPGVDGVFTIRSFREKPVQAVAEEFVKDGNYFWNSGMFVFRADVLLAEMQHYAPEVLQNVQEAFAKRKTDLDFIRLDKDAFAQAPDISIDYAIAEPTQVSAVIPADLGWSDVGSWDALWDISPKTAEGNVLLGDVLVEDAHGCYVRSEGPLTAVSGVDDVVVVVTSDAVLVTRKDRAQDVKKVVDRLKKDGRTEASAHQKNYRPWGFYEGLIRNERFQVKRIVVNPGGKLSLQKHFHRAEHWVVVEGVALVTRGEDLMLVRENESVYLPQGCVHRLENPGKIPLTLIEVQSGAYLGEDDIIRLEDSYNRN
ncbi:mannose-1-phosphate guanylyltransferase/mannose-6-phosphate isomerase [Acetobacter orleanensis]|uniref:mannose-1-phosphate guanylyltransferase n=1 Tax=Acetobacter orleanensis TaxID=104099 RepID=A0A4Y3TQB5_9PROT|nr:mannose-1-phosphate guanylyltransferase/mannose-6-phosphate isomerase [Acetobacter orleanensis]KXV64289.1 mannose-1-phosphate guanyltransferase [Acetobacter orleanensis]PCD79072.1 mannose-1-phosphate guanylyltransferase/mannose-6-phosphate isomerase [Acetobacter orleanensis]GAN69401.1 mannose-1-phosphate guanylyltransferase/mannose-6-phosphate isomerase [Acetobacter orleanensis JCM 7639]GBR22407.1 mannose-1-phosphate guanylyltransferase [Acetobacter orleanensis NRIC 0473]GEB82995.1 mannose-